MAVFRSNKPKPEPAPAIHSLLGKDVLFKGEVHTNSRSFRVEGVVEGTIHSTGEVSIAPGGLVKGTIFAKHLVVTGREASAPPTIWKVEGSLVVDEGGTLQGVCVRKDQSEPVVVAKGGSLPAAKQTDPEAKKADTKR